MSLPLHLRGTRKEESSKREKHYSVLLKVAAERGTEQGDALEIFLEPSDNFIAIGECLEAAYLEGIPEFELED